MNTEYEIKVLDINTADVTLRLQELSFSKPVILNFKRYVYELKDQRTAWIRLRTDGEHATLTYKNFISNSIDGVQELEITVDDFSKTHELLTVMGYEYKTYQENKRTLYKNTDVEIAIDEWPHIPTYLEIEAENEATVKKYLADMGLESHSQTSEPTSFVYEKYGLDINAYKRLTF